MKYKRERSTSSKSKSSKLDRMKLKRILKEQGISSLEAISLLDSSLASRSKKHRDYRRSDAPSCSSRSHERQSNGKRYSRSRVEKNRRTKCSRRNKETSPKISKMYNGHRKHSPSTSSSSSRKRQCSGRHCKTDKGQSEAYKLVQKTLQSLDNNSSSTSEKRRNESVKKQPNYVLNSKATRRKYDSPSTSSHAPEDKYSSSKRYKYSDCFAEYLLANLSSNSLDSTTESEDDSNSADENVSGSSVENDVECNSPIVLESDDQVGGGLQKPTNEETRTTPISTNYDHHTRDKKVKKRRSPKVVRKISPANVYLNSSHDRVNSHTFDDNSSENSYESNDSSGASNSVDSDNNYVYVSKGKMKKKKRPPKVPRKISSTNLHPNRSNDRSKTKQNASKFVVTEVEPTVNAANGNQMTSPEKQNSSVNLSPKSKKERENSLRLALVKYSPKSPRNDEENFDNDDAWSNLSEEDYFSDMDRDSKEQVDKVYIDSPRKTYDLRSFSIQFDSDNDSPQIIEINAHSSTDPHHLVVESEETIEYAEAHNDSTHNYQHHYDDIDDTLDSIPDTTTPFINKFPIKNIEMTSNSSDRLTISEIMLRMSERKIETTMDLSTECVEATESVEATSESVIPPNETVVDTATAPVVEEQTSIMTVDDSPADLSSISMDEDNVPSPDTEIDQNQLSDEDDFIDVQETTPIFFNSSNSRQVLMLLKTKIYFNGALRIRLLGGKANIFGYELEQNKTVVANSPRGHSLLNVSPSSENHQYHIECDKNLEFYLKELSEAFTSSELQQIISNFNSSTDALVLLERDSCNKGIFMIEKYMKQTIFPNINTFSNRRRYHYTESILHCQFLHRTGTGLTINPRWKSIEMKLNSRQMIIGGKGVGKSTLLRYMINKNLKQFEKILLIDLDIGQPEMFLPQTVSATIISEPMLGPGYLLNQSPNKSYLFGDVNVLVSPIKYLKCVLKLLKYCRSCEEFSTMPWVINTMGYNRGFGLELIVAILRALNPTHLIQIQGRRSGDNFEKILNMEEVNDFCLNIFKDEVQDMMQDCSYSTYIFDTVSKGVRKNVWDISPKDLRFAMILSKLGYILQGDANWITDVKPVCASLNDLKIIVVSDDFVNPHLQPNVINGNLVYLCKTTDDDSIDEDIVECYGIGIVRAIDMSTNKIYLLPSILPMELQYVNALAVCSIPLPTSIVMNQSMRITGRVPYVYSSDNFVGSRQIVPISYRPEKRMSNNHVKLV